MHNTTYHSEGAHLQSKYTNHEEQNSYCDPCDYQTPKETHLTGHQQKLHPNQGHRANTHHNHDNTSMLQTTPRDTESSALDGMIDFKPCINYGPLDLPAPQQVT